MTTYQTFSGTFDIVYLGTFLYDGVERDWNIIGYTPEQSAEFTRKHGRLIEVRLYSSILGKFPNGNDAYVVGAAETLEKALDKARFHAIIAWHRNRDEKQ